MHSNLIPFPIAERRSITALGQQRRHNDSRRSPGGSGLNDPPQNSARVLRELIDSHARLATDVEAPRLRFDDQPRASGSTSNSNPGHSRTASEPLLEPSANERPPRSLMGGILSEPSDSLWIQFDRPPRIPTPSWARRDSDRPFYETSPLDFDIPMMSEFERALEPLRTEQNTQSEQTSSTRSRWSPSPYPRALSPAPWTQSPAREGAGASSTAASPTSPRAPDLPMPPAPLLMRVPMSPPLPSQNMYFSSSPPSFIPSETLGSPSPPNFQSPLSPLIPLSRQSTSESMPPSSARHRPTRSAEPWRNPPIYQRPSQESVYDVHPRSPAFAGPDPYNDRGREDMHMQLNTPNRYTAPPAPRLPLRTISGAEDGVWTGYTPPASRTNSAWAQSPTAGGPPTLPPFDFLDGSAPPPGSNRSEQTRPFSRSATERGSALGLRTRTMSSDGQTPRSPDGSSSRRPWSWRASPWPRANDVSCAFSSLAMRDPTDLNLLP